MTDKPGKAIPTDTIVPSTTHAFKIGGRWYWVTAIDSVLESGSQFVMTVPVAKDPRYAQIGMGKLRYVQTGHESFMVRAQTPPVWGWVTRRIDADARRAEAGQCPAETADHRCVMDDGHPGSHRDGGASWPALPHQVSKREPVDPEVFKRTAPQWNCVDYPNDGPHYPSAGNCLWCGMTVEQIAAEWEAAENKPGRTQMACPTCGCKDWTEKS